jgi:hypothetical protein
MVDRSFGPHQRAIDLFRRCGTIVAGPAAHDRFDAVIAFDAF